jgi:hypothetical protein
VIKKQCERCNKYKEDAEEKLNPYIYDMENRKVYETLCLDCYNDLQGSI